MVKTKIIATLGPASETPAVLRKMVRAGMDVARLNFSHGTREEMDRRIGIVRRLNASMRRRVKFLGDLEGPRIRIGAWPGHQPVLLKKGQVFWLVRGEEGAGKDAAPFDYPGSLKGIKRGQPVYIDDGNIYLKTLAVSKTSIKTEVVVGGPLKERKGINMPGAPLEFGGLSAKDARDIDFAAERQLDYLAQSFVRSARDMERVRRRLEKRGGACALVAKIESREGVENIDAILGVTDGIMIARGDMGVCLPIYEVPVVQKRIIRACNRRKKFVITATQMLESMTERRLPTRAEVSDVANAVLDGTDYVMLSAETAAGRYPAEAVDMMNKILKFTEASREEFRCPGF